jgi:transposase
MEDDDASDHLVEVTDLEAGQVARVAAMVATRLPREGRSGRRTQRVWKVAATTNAIAELGT